MMWFCMWPVFLAASVWSASTETRLPESRASPMPDPDGNLHIYALPIGQGDANVVQCPNGTLGLIDFGTSNDATDRFWAGPELTTFLSGKNHLIQNIIITHQHWDHYSLLPETLPTGADVPGLQNIYISCTEANLASTVTDWVSAIGGESLLRTFNGGAACGPFAPSCGTIDICPNDPGVTLQVMAANLGEHCGDGGNVNMNSIVSKITYGTFTSLFPGDFEDEGSDWEEEGIQKMMSDFYGTEMKVVVNHVAHHGATSKANKPVWRDAVAPTFTYASGDPWYGYEHPRCDVFEGFVQFVGTLCKPLVDSSDPFYCGGSTLTNPTPSEILQSAYTCGESGDVVQYIENNEYAIYTTVPSQTEMNMLDISTDGTNYAIRIEPQ